MDRETVDEIKRYFGVVAEGLRSEIRVVAEALSTHAQATEKRFAAVQEELGEIKAMIRLSYRELDGRLRVLETDVVELRSRIERLESRLGN